MSRTAARLTLLVLFAATAACDKVALLAPTGSTLTLSIASTSVGSNGTAEVIATVIESGGTPVHNGTEVTFQASVGRVDPAVVRTESGIARTTFYGNGASGTAKIIAFSGGARSSEVEVRVGSAAAETVTLRLSPSSVPQTGGTVQVSALVRDSSGNPLSGAQVAFSADNGILAANSAVTDANGEASTTLQTNRQTVVRASVAGKEGQATINVVNLPSASVQVSPANPVAGVPVTITVTPGSAANGNPVQNVIVDFGDGTPTAELGAISTAQAVSHVYSRAGTYTVTVTTIDSSGQRNTTSTVITVQSAVVGVSLTGPSTGDAGTSVSFTVSLTNTNNVPITGVRVDFGDGTSATLASSGGTVQKTYSSAGTFTVRATATDQSGNQYQSTQVITIRPRAALQVNLDAAVNENQNVFTCSANYPKTCQAPFAAFVPPPGAQPGVRVVFTAALAGAFASASSYQWNFGDGASETTTSATRDHLYTQRGTYVITVRVTTTDGNSGEQRLTLILF